MRELTTLYLHALREAALLAVVAMLVGFGMWPVVLGDYTPPAVILCVTGVVALVLMAIRGLRLIWTEAFNVLWVLYPLGWLIARRLENGHWF